MADEKLAHYSVIEKIGEGGMGEVFRAHDTRLGRDVALKFLPESLATDADRLARFEREARVLASLNHPHIASIHGFENVDGKRFLVLEMVEGEDLAQRLVRGPMSWQEALPVCQQIAEALEAAHEEGIIHRDLKPANVLLTPGGNAKVLDFGLAKAWEAETTSTNLSNSPTVMASSPTVAGVILGTAAYMSPEQARGHVVDKRADIFGFGCVLYEMLTAKQCFSGTTVSDTLAAVLRAEPDWDALPKDTPRAIVKLLERCLDKDAKRRLRDIGEARIIIDGVLRGEVVDEAAATTVTTTPPRGIIRFVPWVLAGVLAVALGGVWFLGRTVEPPPVIRASIIQPDKVRFNLRGIHPGPVSISPDGRRIAFAGRAPGAGALLYVRDLDDLESRTLSGTEGAGYPFWSPDGRSIGFFAAGKLKRVEVSGAPPVTLCEAPVGKGGTWNKAGTILFSPTFSGVLHQVSQAGGASTPVTALRTNEGENSHRFPRFLPDGEHFLYLARLGGDANSIRVGSLSGDVDKEVLRAASHAEYANGYLLFLREATLMAQPFDADKLELRGEPTPVADPVRFIPAAMRGVFTASNNGTLVYQAGSSVPGAQLVWRNREGKELGRTGDIIMQDSPAVSPNGRFVAVDAFLTGGTGDLWIYDVERDLRTRFTFDTAADENAVWSPDGSRIAFSSARDNHSGIYLKEFGGASVAQLLLETSSLAFPTDWTRDGRYMVYFENDSLNTGNIYALPMDGSRDAKPFPVVATSAGEYRGMVSADGYWIAYFSDESGRFECYVTSFPKPSRKWQVSTSGGNQIYWDPKSRGVYYFGTDNHLYFVEATWDASNFALGQTHTLFESNTALAYNIAPDGEHVLILEDADEGSIVPLTLVTNWDADLKARMRR